MLKRLKQISWIRTLLTFSIVGLDQISKYLIQNYMMPSETVKLSSYLNFHLTYNKGITFGLLSQLNLDYYLLLLITLLPFAFLLYIYNIAKQNIQYNQYRKLHTMSYACAVGGGVGNLLDRILQSKVTDFIDFHIGRWHFFTFNLADVSIVLGLLILCILIWLKGVTINTPITRRP